MHALIVPAPALTELAGLHGLAQILSETGEKFFVDRHSDLGPRRADVGGTVSLLRAGEKRELAHDEVLAFRIEEGEVHLPRIVFEDPQIQDF